MKLIDLLSSALKARLQNCVSICFPGFFQVMLLNHVLFTAKFYKLLHPLVPGLCMGAL